MVAGPLWGAISLLQAIGREGFDLTRHPLSALGAGTLGWVQIINFVVAGLLFLAGALGLRRVMAGEPGGVWAPRLVGLAGMGMIAAGVLVMDPADGFPVGTPEGAPASLSWHAAGHLMAGALSFLALILACWVLGRNFSRAGLRRHATVSRVAGTLLLVGNAWAMSGAPAGSLALAVGGITAMVWVSAVTGLHRRGS
ncbi:DUF998 domain-containing protein [Streptomyces sp. IF17]|nr:DUF998 domain-containing protein [Streptomyces alkaliphilus]